MTVKFKGARWFKCDLHLHTPASQCFEDRSVLAKQWVDRAIKEGLDCVAVTDHNTGDWVDAIKEAAVGTRLTVFPGVELTCDTSKIHLLVIFDINKSTNDVNDFIIKSGIQRSMLANKLAGTTKNIFEIAKEANEEGAIVIPAHIDEFNGLEAIGNENLTTFFKLPYINAVHIVHNVFTDPALQTNKNEELLAYINNYYNNPKIPIDFSQIAAWHKPVKKAIENKLALLSFSDNPHAPNNSHHGLAGMGSRYTWIKMDENPTLEGLRQAFLLPDFRVKNGFMFATNPYHMPDLWIKSISIHDSVLTEQMTIDLSPQLTTIIGGRGSGKSSILRFIRGVFNRTADISTLPDILKSHDDFYKSHDHKSKKGVVKASTTITIEIVRHGVLYRISASNISTSRNQNLKLERYDKDADRWDIVDQEGFIDFFEFEQYSQKQIYEVAQEPNALKDRIDASISEVADIRAEMEIARKSFLEKSAAIRTIKQKLSGKGKLQTEIADIDDRIKKYQESGIASLLSSKEKFSQEEKVLQEFVKEAKSREELISSLIQNFAIEEADFSNFSKSHSEELSVLSQSLVNGFAEVKARLEKLKAEAEGLRLAFETGMLTSSWQEAYNTNLTEFNAKKEELEAEGIKDITNFELLTESKTLKEAELADLSSLEANLGAKLSVRAGLKNDFVDKIKRVTELRKEFVASCLQDDKVRITINNFRNKSDFVNKLRLILQRDKGFEADIENLTTICFTGNVENNLSKIVNIFCKIRRDERVTEVSGHFVNLVKAMTDGQVDEVELLVPDDEIEVKYKPSGGGAFKPLSTASAGQKTTAILTLILAYGKIPLILDQPEDDLDNRLVYELIVDRLKQAKECRQLIIVTHNANIPVNGDAEYVISMNSESKKLNVLCAGTLEQPIIKKEICDVMEGSEHAFDMRSKRYKSI